MINCINLYGLLDVSDSEDFEPRGCIDHGSSEPQSLVPPLASQVEEDPALAVTQAGVVDEDPAPAVTEAGVRHRPVSSKKILRRLWQRPVSLMKILRLRKRARQSGQEYMSSHSSS